MLSPASAFSPKKKRVYPVTATKRAYRYVAVRRAVLGVLLPRWATQTNQAAQDAVRGMWHARLGELRKAKWPPVADKSTLA